MKELCCWVGLLFACGMLFLLAFVDTDAFVRLLGLPKMARHFPKQNTKNDEEASRSSLLLLT
jgi:hypothetical protein